MRVLFHLYSIKMMDNVNRRFLWIGEFLEKFFYSTKYDLQKAEIDTLPEKYFTSSFFSALVFGLLGFIFIFGLFTLRDSAILQENVLPGVIAGFFSFFVLLLLYIYYPSILAKNLANEIDNSLVFALKSILIQVTSGVSLYNAMVNVSKSKYGIISKEFEKIVQEISSGVSETKALEKLALNTRSEQLKKTIWQLITSLKSGASLTGALNSVVNTLSANQLRAIKNYSAELNMWILIYLLLAAAVPTLGITFLVILSSMGGASVSQEMIFSIVLFAFFAQIILIGFIKTRIPRAFA